eukprot:6181782-Pleurochrysis_carterae.AAC.1
MRGRWSELLHCNFLCYVRVRLKFKLTVGLHRAQGGRIQVRGTDRVSDDEADAAQTSESAVRVPMVHMIQKRRM